MLLPPLSGASIPHPMNSASSGPSVKCSTQSPPPTQLIQLRLPNHQTAPIHELKFLAVDANPNYFDHLREKITTRPPSNNPQSFPKQFSLIPVSVLLDPSVFSIDASAIISNTASPNLTVRTVWTSLASHDPTQK